MGDLRASCPAIGMLVWRPGVHHQKFTEIPWYREEVRRYTELVFSQWPTLQRFETLRLDIPEGEEGLKHVGYVRTAEEHISMVPAVYDAEAWKRGSPLAAD